MTNTRWTFLAAACVALAACGGEKSTKSDTTQATAPSTPGAPGTAAAPSAGGPQEPDAGRKIITVSATTDAQGNNKFDPAEIEAQNGDVVRFTLGTGVHNVHFLADSNPGKQGLPPASDMLQIPGQTYDLKVTLAPGTYYYQCDPHALLGMKGHLTVKE
jgi:plastocyanin